MLRFVLAALASRYEIDTTSHGTSDSDSGDMEVDGHTADGGDDEEEEMEDGEEEGEEEE